MKNKKWYIVIKYWFDENDYRCRLNHWTILTNDKDYDKIKGESHIEEIAAELNVPVVGKMPIDMEYASKADSGAFDQIDNEYITKAVEVMPE